jgi:hypothetical protein
LLNVATPLAALTDVVPPKPDGVELIVMAPAKLVITVPLASSAATAMFESVVPAFAPLGGVVNANCDGVMVIVVVSG